MFESMIGWVLERPARPRTLGHVVWAVGAGQMLLGIVQASMREALTHVAPVGVSMPQSLFPSAIAWAVPDSALAFALAGFALGIGIVMALTGKQIQQLHDA